MATLIPARAACLARMTGGERRFSERIEKKLEDDYLAWFDVPVGPKPLRPNFVLVHPRRGLWVLELRDWLIGTIRAADRQRTKIIADGALHIVANPVEQARLHTLEIDVLLRRDPAMRNPSGHAQAGKLILPLGYGIVLASITRAQFREATLDRFFPAANVICKDEMTEDADAGAFEARLAGMLVTDFPCALPTAQLDRIRAHLFPQVCVNSAVNQFGHFDPGQKSAPGYAAVMEIEQEVLARSTGEGHRVVHGVAGSGKTMILEARCLELAREAGKPILVLCFNVTLAARLRQMMERHGISERVHVCQFFEWCGEMLETYQLDIPRPDSGRETFFADLVAQTMRGVESGRIPRGRYAAVMIDEGHDFHPEWLRLAVQMVDPVTDDLLVLFDAAQALHGPASRVKFRFSNAGIQAPGRTTILKRNQRNTREIFLVARRFADHLLLDRFTDEDEAPTVDPEPSGRTGEMPSLLSAKSAQAEAKLVVDWIAAERKRGVPLSEIGIVYRRDAHIVDILGELERRGIPSAVADSSDNKRTLFLGDPSVKMVTMFGAKGIEFRSVVIPRVCQMPDAETEHEESEARLLYVGLTRATERLIMTRIGESAFSKRLDRAIRVADAALLLTT